MTHVRTAPYYPQSNGKLERWHKTIKADAIRVSPPSSLAEARALVARFVAYYNGVRLHSAIATSRRTTSSQAAPRPSGPSATGSFNPGTRLG
jgi:transposase InsO family protein